MHVLTKAVGRYCIDACLGFGPDRWAVLEWGAEWVVYDSATGSCHLLSESAGAVFEALLQSAPGSMDASQVCATALDSELEQVSADDEQVVIELLAGLREAGLVHEADS